jgi:arylsulfatase A-like enzyme
MRFSIKTISFTTASGILFGWLTGLPYVVQHLVFEIDLWYWKAFIIGLAIQIFTGAVLGFLLGIIIVLFINLITKTPVPHPFLVSATISAGGFVIVSSICFFFLLPAYIRIISFVGITLLCLILVLALGAILLLNKYFTSRKDSLFSKFVERPSKLWGLNLALLTGSLCVVGIIFGVGNLVDKLQENSLVKISKNRPNVILIVLDTLRRDHLSCYGYGKETSPFIDSLALEGVRFTNAISTSCYTSPAHASLLTGKLPSTHGVIGRNRFLSEDIARLPGLLTESGYYTAGIVSNLYLHSYFGYEKGFTSYNDNLIKSEIEYWIQVGILGSIIRVLSPYLPFFKFLPFLMHKQNFASNTTDEAINEINSAPDNRPYFLFINYIDPHFPYSPPDEYLEQFLPEDKSVIKRLKKKEMKKLLFDRKTLGNPDNQTEIGAEEIAFIESSYDGEIRYLDDHLRRLFEYLEENGRLDNTLVFITSDHGELFGEHKIYLHANSLYEDLVRVPLIILWPDKIKPDLWENRVSLLSIPSTILDAARITIPDDMEGISLLTSLVSREKTEETIIVSEWYDNRAIYLGNTKGIIYKDRLPEIYNLQKDPNELNNLLEQYPDSADVFLMTLQQFQDRKTGIAENNQRKKIPEHILKALRSLGYVN